MNKLETPLVSIVIPTFNRARTIVRSVHSILTQTFQDFEIIIIDDCSTDNTEDIIKSKFNDKRIIYYKLEKNSGACVARNKGIELARGKYIAFQDSDDEWLCEKLEKQVNILENNNNYQATFCQFIRINNNNTSIIPVDGFNDKEMKYMIFGENFISTQTLLVRREVFIKIGIFDISLPRFQDWELAIRLINKCNVFYQKEPLVIMYIQKDSISRNNIAKIKALELIVNKYRNEYNNYPKYHSKLLRRLTFWSYIYLFDYSKQLMLKNIIKAIRLDKLNYRNWFVFLFILIPLSIRIKKKVVTNFINPNSL